MIERSAPHESRPGEDLVRNGKVDLPVESGMPVINSRRLVALALVGLVAAGCGSTTVPGTPSPAAAGGGGTGSGTGGDTVDACALLKPAEVQSLIGANDGGKGTTEGRSVCTWTTADERSVTVDLAQPGTAPNGLPAWDPALGPERPLPDGMRSLGGGQVEFVAGTRDCTVQVVTDPTDENDEQRAVALAKVLQSRL
jgi:hypothetical protein